MIIEAQVWKEYTLFCFYFVVSHSSAQELLLIVQSEITPDRFGRPFKMAGIEPRSNTCKGKALPAVLIL